MRVAIFVDIADVNSLGVGLEVTLGYSSDVNILLGIDYMAIIVIIIIHEIFKQIHSSTLGWIDHVLVLDTRPTEVDFIGRDIV